MTLHFDDDQLEIHKLVVGPYDNNVFVLRCKATGDAVLLDAANEHEKLLELRAVAQRPPRARDPRALGPHPGRAGDARGRLRGGGDRARRADASRTSATTSSWTTRRSSRSAGSGSHAIHTPGHTEGSICFKVSGSPIVFSGDTLFPGGPGNATFEGGDFATIIQSIDSKLFTLPPDTIVLPGHGDDTTIGTERPHLQEWIDRGW